MLTVLSSIHSENTHLEIDEYVPFIFRNLDTQNAVPFYWRTGDFKSSLLEIGIDPESGVLSVIRVPFFRTYERSLLYWQKPDRNKMNELPVCNINIWQESDDFSKRFHDESFAFKTIIGRNYVAFLLNSTNELDSFYTCGQVCIGIDKEKTIRKIEFIDLSGDDIQMITRSDPTNM